MVELQDYLDFREVIFEVFIKSCRSKRYNMMIEAIYTIRIIKDEMAYYLMRYGYNKRIL